MRMVFEGGECLKIIQVPLVNEPLNIQCFLNLLNTMKSSVEILQEQRVRVPKKSYPNPVKVIMFFVKIAFVYWKYL